MNQPRTQVFLGLGTNLGDRQENLRRAVLALEPGVGVRRVSHIYETPPWGVLEQPVFLNLALEGETELEPLELLRFVKALEVSLGRTVTYRYGPRLIDIDILFFGERRVDLPELTIPHPRMAQRGFVLAPLVEIAPQHVHPVTGLTVGEMLAGVDLTGIHPLD